MIDGGQKKRYNYFKNQSQNEIQGNTERFMRAWRMRPEMRRLFDTLPVCVMRQRAGLSYFF